MLLTFVRLQQVDLSLNCNAYIESEDRVPVFFLQNYIYVLNDFVKLKPLILQAMTTPCQLRSLPSTYKISTSYDNLLEVN